MGLNINDINEALEDGTVVDQSVAQTGGGNFERKLLPIGRHPIRLVSYVELGMQEGGMYDGKPKPDELQARMVFEFLGKRTVEETTKEDGTTSLYAPRKALTKKLSYHTKAGFYKLFMQLRGGDSTITHMGQMIATKAWLVTVVWRTKNDAGEYVTIAKKDVAEYEQRLKDAKTDQQKKDYRIFDNIEWSTLGAPVMPILDEDGEDTGETKPVAVREHIGALQLFMWDNPQTKFWESIHIEGTYTKKVEGKDVEVSKNFIQDMILGAKNYAGSPLQAMLEGLDDLPGMADNGDTPGETGSSDMGKSAVNQTATDQSENTGTADSATGATTSPSDDDEMDELGLC